MSPEFTTVLLKKHLDGITSCIRCLRQQQDAETIHNFRLEVKKTRARLRMLSFTHQQNFRLPAAIKNIYHLTGHCRDSQLLLQTTQSLCHKLSIQPPMNYLLSLQNEIDECAIMLSIRCTALHPAKTFPAWRQHINTRITPRGPYHWYLTRLQEILANSLLPLTATRLHAIRKLSKDVLYNWKYLPHSGPDRITPEKKELATLTDTLGQYHDRVIAIQMITAAIPTNPADADALQLLHSAVQQEQTAFETTCRRLVTQFTERLNITPHITG